MKGIKKMSNEEGCSDMESAHSKQQEHAGTLLHQHAYRTAAKNEGLSFSASHGHSHHMEENVKVECPRLECGQKMKGIKKMSNEEGCSDMESARSKQHNKHVGTLLHQHAYRTAAKNEGLPVSASHGHSHHMEDNVKVECPRLECVQPAADISECAIKEERPYCDSELEDNLKNPLGQNFKSEFKVEANEYVTSLYDICHVNVKEERLLPEVAEKNDNSWAISDNCGTLGEHKFDIEIEDGELFQQGADSGPSDSVPKFCDTVNEIKLEGEMWPSCSQATSPETSYVGNISQSKDAAFSTPCKGSSHTMHNEQSTDIVHQNMISACSVSENCNNKFASVKLLKSHSNACVAQKSFKCDIIHTGKKTVECKIYNRKLSNYSNFKTYPLRHTEKNHLECKICEKKFSRSDSLNRHSLLHTVEKSFECKICNKTFSDKCHLKRHSVIHIGEKTFECNVCNKKFSTMSGLKSHSLVHTGERPFECEICNKKFSDRRNLKRHSLIHTGEKPFECKICNKNFSLRTNLNTHLLIHTGEKPFKCTICSETFSRNRTLNTHSLAHTGEKPFECTICNKTFCLKNVLKRHSLLHTREKPFECKICSKKFYDSSNCRKHSLTHSREKPLKCKVNGKQSSDEGNHMQHVLIHTGEQPSG